MVPAFSTRSFSITRLSTIALIMLTACSGSGDGDAGGCVPKNGLYVYCDGTASDLYYETLTPGPCVSGYCREPIRKFGVCLGREHYNETGGTGYGDIDLDTWTNDADDIDYIRSICVAECKNRDYDGNGNCNQNSGEGVLWEIKNYLNSAVPDPGQQINNPWHLACMASQANLAPLPSDTTVIPSGTSPAWPSNPSQGFSLSCGDFETCANEFAAPILGFLGYDDTTDPWSEDMGRGAHLATTSTSSVTGISITIENPGGPSSDTHSASGRVEYSAPDCGQTECAFYLANLTLSNTTDTWQVYSHSLDDTVYFTDVTLQLRRPTLGVWNTLTNEVYLGEKRIDMLVTGTVQIGTGTPLEGTYLVTNLEAIFGELGTGGELQVLGLVAEDGDLSFEADLDYDVLSGSPPAADNGLSGHMTAPTSKGLRISTITDGSSDPDSDIENKIWFVNDIERPTSYFIPTGTHTVSLMVTDERGAVDIHESVVTVAYP